jgi:uncharacterized protein YyaL (SSP411 family)
VTTDAFHTNRLAREKSPYLLQHQHNPVDWYPWGQEAFAKALREDKPIFLSIGYSTCHWCHVMERESFENREVADFLKAHFISIKLDREERPDVDKIYMTAVQAMSGQGGWPLNCFLTPDLHPFYGGTYFPPEPKYGHPSFMQVLSQIAKIWESRRDQILQSATGFYDQLKSLASAAPAKAAISPETLDHAMGRFKREYDYHFGGFGGPPKFPRPSQPIFMLWFGSRAKDTDAIDMVLKTCDFMAAGGICDQLGGGFARYSVDERWLVPHFEKMLYDNAQLLELYLDAFLISGEPRHAQTARDIIEYVSRDLADPEGGFYSAEDADSEGKEGKFYCWTSAELSRLLTTAELAVAKRYFGLTDKGNFLDHSDPNPLPNQNILSVVDPKLSPEEKTLLDSARAKMFKARSGRIRPHRDDKVLSSWNGMMLAALARAYAVLGDDSFRKAAEKNVAFIKKNLWDAATRTLYHRWREGERDSVQLLRAYAQMMTGALNLYEATLAPEHLDFSVALAETVLAKFYDPANGGFFESLEGSKDLILRVKEDYDGAEPSGNSVATLTLLRLGAITGRKEFTAAAEKTLNSMASRLNELPQAVPHLLMAADFFLTSPGRAVITGSPDSPEASAMLRAIHSVFQPHKVILGTAGPVEDFAKTLPQEKAPMVYLCSGTACQPPTTDPQKIKESLRSGNFTPAP